MIDLRDLLSRLQKVVEKSSGQYMACCPAHSDKRQSLAVRMGEKGIVLHCHAGCSTDDILSTLGLTVKDITKDEEWRGRSNGQRPPARASAPPKPAPPPEPKKKTPADLARLREGCRYKNETITKVYDYTDSNGRTVLKVMRTDAKSFPVVHLDKDGLWYWGDGGMTDLLYNLPAVEQAVNNQQPVWIVEGEKDVDTLQGLGITATCNKGGAGKWPDGLNASFLNAIVVICPDVDEPGQKHGKIVAKAVGGYAKEVRLVNLRRAKGVKLPDKGDVSDLVAQFEQPEDAAAALSQLMEEAVFLSRRVSDDDYVDYFDGIPGCIVDNGCIHAVTANGTEMLSNFVALPIE